MSKFIQQYQLVSFPTKEVKEYLQTIYDDLKLNKKAKATDINEFCNKKKKKRYVNKTTIDTIIFE